MAVSICQIYYLHVANEEIESSCVACPGSYLKSGSFAYFLTWDETIRPLYLSLGGSVRRWCAGHAEIEVLLLTSAGQNFSHAAWIFFHFVSNESLCWLAERIYVYPKVYWNKGQLLAAALWREGKSGRWSWKPNGFYQGHALLPPCIWVSWFLKTASKSLFLSLNEQNYFFICKCVLNRGET